MRKLILIAAVSLLPNHAYAGSSRGLSLAAANAKQPVTEQAATSSQATSPSPANVQTATTTPTSPPPAATASTATAPVQSSPAPAARTIEAPKPKRRQPSVEARVIRELHRHGIYW
ncbi:hypothetical protein LPJ38_02170 [Bradyrhizobium daqingense]|uniref:hypothetical protein n=1 Tax=Bradyrhizobium daqingense TaxID=993502 RepID=UPI0011A07024|nr:hypothetical protein [Bradyrhizobium daqingense]UFS89616.1 hypothetical protein LPJ38_02170 [Bradyrhizobium daqingense]